MYTLLCVENLIARPICDIEDMNDPNLTDQIINFIESGLAEVDILDDSTLEKILAEELLEISPSYQQKKNYIDDINNLIAQEDLPSGELLEGIKNNYTSEELETCIDHISNLDEFNNDAEELLKELIAILDEIEVLMFQISSEDVDNKTLMTKYGYFESDTFSSSICLIENKFIVREKENKEDIEMPSVDLGDDENTIPMISDDDDIEIVKEGEEKEEEKEIELNINALLQCIDKKAPEEEEEVAADREDDGDEDVEVNYSEKTNKELRQICKDFGIASSGKKDILVDRIQKYLKGELPKKEEKKEKSPAKQTKRGKSKSPAKQAKKNNKIEEKETIPYGEWNLEESNLQKCTVKTLKQICSFYNKNQDNKEDKFAASKLKKDELIEKIQTVIIPTLGLEEDVPQSDKEDNVDNTESDSDKEEDSTDSDKEDTSESDAEGNKEDDKEDEKTIGNLCVDVEKLEISKNRNGYSKGDLVKFLKEYNRITENKEDRYLLKDYNNKDKLREVLQDILGLN